MEDPLSPLRPQSQNESCRRPLIQILTNSAALSPYATLLPTPPPIIQIPTKRQVRDAVRCAKSGMVPGAIRKYILQKKKHEESDPEDPEADLEQEDLEEGHDNAEDVVVPEVEPEICILSVQSQAQTRAQSPATTMSIATEVVDSDADTMASKRVRPFTKTVSPDTTTPDEILAAVETNKKARLNVEGEVTPSRPRGRPKTKAQVKHNSPPMTINSAPASPPFAISMGRPKKVREDSESSKSSKSPMSGAKPNYVRKLVVDPPQPRPTFKKQQISISLEKQVQKNAWKPIITQWEGNLRDRIIPVPRHVGDLIKRGILTIGTRVAKEIPALGLDFFALLVKEYPIGVLDEAFDYYANAFTQTSSDNCTMPEFLFHVLEALEADTEARLQSSQTLPFFKILTKMIVQQYKEYEGLDVKLRRPFFLKFFEEHERSLTYNMYCKKLVQSAFKLKDHSDEFKFVMRWIGLLSYHLKRHHSLDAEFKRLVEDFVDELISPKYFPCVCDVVQGIADENLGAAVCIGILMKKIKFQNVHNKLVMPSVEQITDFFKILAKSELIKSVKISLRERRHSIELLANSKNGNSNGSSSANHSASPKKSVNMKGESYLHKLCRKLSSPKELGRLSDELQQTLKRKQFPVNPTDNFGNTPLHDAIAHGRIDALDKFCDYCSDPNMPEDLRVDVLAQTVKGDTPFHLAASVVSEQHSAMLDLLIHIADKLQVKEDALKMLNNDGKMPFQLAFDGGTRSKLKPAELAECISETKDVCVHPVSRAELQTFNIQKLVLLWSEFSEQKTPGVVDESE